VGQAAQGGDRDASKRRVHNPQSMAVLSGVVYRGADVWFAQDASSSDSDLLKSSPAWPPRPRSPPHHNSTPNRARPAPADASLSDSARSVSSQEADEAARAAEELAAKKTRVKQSLMKRARSVAIFSLKLKERRAREAAEKAANKPVTPTAPLPPPQCGGGELSCIPIEKVGGGFEARDLSDK
jgi:anoctamin-8